MTRTSAHRSTPSGGAYSRVDRPVIAVPPDPPAWLPTAVEEGGGVVGPLDQADGYVHLGGTGALPALPAQVRWVQLPGAGVEAYLEAGLVDRSRTWTSAAGVYADTVAEHAVALLLAGVRGLVAASGLRSWEREQVAQRISGLAGSRVAVIGAGGIGRRIIDLLLPHRVSVIAVNRSGRRVSGAAQTVPVAAIDRIWDQVDHLILAAPATADSRHLVDAAVLARLQPSSWIVNIARGTLIDTDALVLALTERRIAGAALDVTDPEPLPDGHPLWSAPGVLITPHTANPADRLWQALAGRVRSNVERFATGAQLLGRVDVDAGY